MYVKKSKTYEGNLTVYKNSTHENSSPCCRQKSYHFLKIENGVGKFMQEQLIPEKIPLSEL